VGTGGTVAVGFWFRVLGTGAGFTGSGVGTGQTEKT